MRRTTLLLLLVAGCIAPPAVRSVRYRPFDLASFPAGTERVEIGRREKLRGVFVPGRPVVVFLLESGGTITRGATAGDGYELVWDLHALGMGLLCVDYRGVGESDGEASVRNLRADVRAVWREAVRRAGDPGRVVLRGVSLGGLGASLLLDGGAAPAAVVVAAPVRAETAVRRFADEWTDGLEHVFARLLVRRPAKTDIVAALDATQAPTLVVAGGEDAYLDDRERTLFRRAADRYAETGEDHLELVHRARGLLEEERSFYLQRFPALPRIAKRLARIREQVPGAPPDGELAAFLARFAFDVGPRQRRRGAGSAGRPAPRAPPPSPTRAAPAGAAPRAQGRAHSGPHRDRARRPARDRGLARRSLEPGAAPGLRSSESSTSRVNRRPRLRPGQFAPCFAPACASFCLRSCWRANSRWNQICWSSGSTSWASSSRRRPSSLPESWRSSARPCRA